LEQLCQLSPEIEASAIMDADGSLLAVCASVEVEDVLAPMLTTLMTVSDQTSQELGRGAVEILMTYGPEGWLIAQMIDTTRVLAVLCRPEGSLGLILDDLQACRDLVLASAA